MHSTACKVKSIFFILSHIGQDQLQFSYIIINYFLLAASSKAEIPVHLGIYHAFSWYHENVRIVAYHVNSISTFLQYSNELEFQCLIRRYCSYPLLCWKGILKTNISERNVHELVFFSGTFCYLIRSCNDISLKWYGPVIGLYFRIFWRTDISHKFSLIFSKLMKFLSTTIMEISVTYLLKYIETCI